MRFDDRLATVLNQPVSDPHDVAVRWRQLVELVARGGTNGASPLVDQAIELIRAEAHQVEDRLRAAAARGVAAVPIPFGLLRYFASDKLSVSAPVLAAASLDAASWKALSEGADDETRRFITALHPELSGDRMPPPSPAASQPATTPPAPAPSLHAVVERIEQRRRSRERERATSASQGTTSCLFRWESGPGGQISWVDGVPRGPLIGRLLTRVQDVEGHSIDETVPRAMTLRAPFHDAGLTISGASAVAGDWKISGVPAFDPADGRFAGYRGVAVREQAGVADEDQALLSHPDSVRELVHEIKTPLNAIIGFAEIIDAQLLGPAAQGYRKRAMEIVHQAQLLLGAINDLDLAATLRSAPSADRRTDLGALLGSLASELREAADDRGLEFDFFAPPHPVAVAEPVLAERLLRRVVIGALDDGAAGEVIRVSGLVREGVCGIAVSRPLGLRDQSDDDLFSNGAWRLARGLAGMAGATIELGSDVITVTFPRA